MGDTTLKASGHHDVFESDKADRRGLIALTDDQLEDDFLAIKKAKVAYRM